MKTEDYNYLSFDNGSTSKEVATVFGKTDSGDFMQVEFENSSGETEEISIKLPEGIGNAGINFIPTAALQANVGVLKGTEVKVRYFPKINLKDFSTTFYGGAIQHEFTQWIPAEKAFPLHISGLIGYTALNAKYDLDSQNNFTSGKNQQIKADTDSWLFSAIVSTNLPVIDFYAGLGYVTGKTKTSLKGTYEIKEGVLKNQSVTDPYSLSIAESGMKGTVGFKLKLGFFKFHTDYSFQKYNNLSVGLNFGI